LYSCLFLLIKICDGQGELISKYDLKKRNFIGTTTMAAEVALFAANQALVKKKKHKEN